MEERKSINTYIAMAIGSIGMILLAIGMVNYLYLARSGIGLTLTVIGFITMVHYIYHLEKKAGISNRFISIRVVVLVLAVLGFTYYYY